MLGMRHQPQHVARLVPQPRDVVGAAVRVEALVLEAVGRAVAKRDLAPFLDSGKDLRGGDPLALAVLDRDLQDLPGLPARPAFGRRLRSNTHPAADEAEAAVADERPRQVPGL